MLDDDGETNTHPADEGTSMNEGTSTDTSTEQHPRKILSDEELWQNITAFAEKRSGEYVDGQDDLKLQLSPFSPFVEEDKNSEMWYG